MYHFLSVDVITIEKTGENFRLMYDVKGRFTVHRIGPEEAKVGGTLLDEYPVAMATAQAGPPD